MKKNNRRSSEILMELAQDKSLKGVLTYGEILEALGERAFGIVLLFFALPSALPFSAIPGVSFIFSVPIMILALQMIIGRKKLWLPKIIADREISHKKVTKIINAAVPYLKKMDRLLSPRWYVMTSRVMEIINGGVIFCLGVLLTLPIPFSNFILAMLIIIFSLGLIARDGVFIALGYFCTIVYIGFIYVFILAAIKAIF